MYSKDGQGTTGSHWQFREWDSRELEWQAKAREEITQISAFPELERRIIAALGPTAEAILVHQLVYWFGKQKMQTRWTAYKTFGEWRDERGLNRKQVEKGRSRLRPSGVVEEVTGPYKRIYYRIDWVSLGVALKLWDDPRTEPGVAPGVHHSTSGMSPLKGVQSMTASPKGGTEDSESPKGGTEETVPPTSGSKQGGLPHGNRESPDENHLNPPYKPTQENTQEPTQELTSQDNSLLQRGSDVAFAQSEPPSLNNNEPSQERNNDTSLLANGTSEGSEQNDSHEAKAEWHRRFREIPAVANMQLLGVLKRQLAEPFRQCVAGDVTCEEIADQARPLLNGVQISDEHLLLGVELWAEDERG